MLETSQDYVTFLVLAIVGAAFVVLLYLILGMPAGSPLLATSRGGGDQHDGLARLHRHQADVALAEDEKTAAKANLAYAEYRKNDAETLRSETLGRCLGRTSGPPRLAGTLQRSVKPVPS